MDLPADNFNLIMLTKKQNSLWHKERFDALKEQLWPQVLRCVEMAAEKGSSSWLTALPI